MLQKIELVTKVDHDEIVNLWEASVRATHHFLQEADIEFYKKLLRENYVKTAKLHCVRDNYKILGFLGVEKTNVDMLFIHPDARGKGVGKLLMQFAFENYNADKVDVNEDNRQAVGFYKHLGFKTISRSDIDPTGKPYPILHMKLEK